MLSLYCRRTPKCPHQDTLLERKKMNAAMVP